MRSPFQLRSLKLRLLLPYVLLIVALTAVIGGLTYFAAAHTVTALSQRALQQMAVRMHENVLHHVSGSAAVLEAAFPRGMAAAPDMQEDWPALRARLWAATTLHPQTNLYVYYANVAGQGVGLKRLPDGTAELRVRAADGQKRDFYALDSIDGQARYLRTEKTMFEPRLRPWFQLAAQSDRHTWTSVYIDFSMKDLVLTRARRVLNAQGAFEGVVATDVSLTALSGIVDDIARSVQGRAFIVQQGGELVAASDMPNVRFNDAGRIERVTVHTGGDAVLLTSFEQIQADMHQAYQASSPPGSSPETHSFLMKDPQGGQVHAAFVRVRDEAGLDWIAAVAVPRATILADVSRMVRWVFIASALSLLLALTVGMYFFGSIADDVRKLSRAVRRFGQGDISTQLETSRNDEVGELARNFSHMRHELFTDPLTGVTNRSALQHLLARLTAQMPVVPFAVLFMDLNLFKPLNDRWGHDNGDLALKEVAQRLQTRLRAGDHVARLGGDEFVVVLRSVDQMAVAQSVSGQLIDVISAPLTSLQGIPEGTSVHLGASVGIALYPLHATDVQSLLKYADQQMYVQKAKRPVSEQR